MTGRRIVEKVDFAVPTNYSIGDRFDTFGAALEAAVATIKATRYRGQRLRAPEKYPAVANFHAKRYSEQCGDLVIDSRAFVQLRVVEPIQDRGDNLRSGLDGVLMTWEVFRDGTAETMPGR